MAGKTIKLYPSSWLYNAGVIGFLRVMEEELGEEVAREYIKIHGSVIFLDLEIFRNIAQRVDKLHLGDNAKIELKIVGKNTYHPNYWQSGWSKKGFKFALFVQKLQNVKEGAKECGFCSGNFGLSDTHGIPEEFLKGIAQFNSRILAMKLGSAFSEMPNSAWNFKSTLPVCHLCAYLLLYTPLGMVKGRNGSFFINAPSFTAMYYLNRYASEMARIPAEDLRRILGLSMLEMAIRTNVHLDLWTMMNVEIVRVKGKNVEYFSLPEDVSSILSDKRIASLIKEIDGVQIGVSGGKDVNIVANVLEDVLNRNYGKLLYYAYMSIRWMMKSGGGNNEMVKKFLQLYDLILQKVKQTTEKEVSYAAANC